MFKFVSLRKFKLAQNKWQKEEENLLIKIIKYYSNHLVRWAFLIGKLSLKNFIKKILKKRYLELQSNAVNTGAAI
jgi:hypothetical protein